MAAKVIILGSGTGIPVSNRFPSAFLIEKDSDLTLIDIGPGILTQVERAGYCYSDINRLFITHIHPDHCLDLARFLFSLKYDINAQLKHLEIIMHEKYIPYIKRYLATFGKWVEPEGLTLQWTGLTGHGQHRDYLWTAMPHHASSLAYRFTIQGNNIAFTGDTVQFDTSIDFWKKINWLFIEAGKIKITENSKHLFINETLTLIEKIQPTNARIVHIYPQSEMTVKSAMAQLQTDHAVQTIQIAYDLEEIHLHK